MEGFRFQEVSVVRVFTSFTISKNKETKVIWIVMVGGMSIYFSQFCSFCPR